MTLPRLPTLLVLPALLAAASVAAQEAPREVVLPFENVRYDYAHVLAVRPVYQVLRTTSVERVCNGDGSGNVLSRVVNVVKDRLGGADDAHDRAESNCRMTPVSREYRRTIAYDVDYMYRGSKFRTRMDRDPGNRLRIRISITPHPID